MDPAVRNLLLVQLLAKRRQQEDYIPPDEHRTMVAKAEADPIKHHTVGVYNNDEYKENCVPSGELEQHVQYNIDMRPGRALFVDGKCVHRGYLSEERCKAWEEKLVGWPMPRISYPRH
jgi:hypothetical protein